MIKKIIVIVAAIALLEFAITTLDGGPEMVLDGGQEVASNDPSQVSNRLISIPPIELITAFYAAKNASPNNCNDWLGNESTHHHIGWKFKAADVDLPSGLGGISSTPPTPAGTDWGMTFPDPLSTLAVGWNYWYEDSGESLTRHAHLVALKTDPIFGGDDPCQGTTAIFPTWFGQFSNGTDTWQVTGFSAS